MVSIFVCVADSGKAGNGLPTASGPVTRT